jgi:NAD(P)H-hydrate epimerase
MKIFSAEQFRSWDAFTVEHEPITSVELMERAAQACVNWMVTKEWEGKPIKVFCGKGNNGGDGLAIARLLIDQGYYVEVYILEFGKQGSDEFQQNLQRLHNITDELHFLQSQEQFPFLQTKDIIIDALFGTGLNKPLHGLSAELIRHINDSGATVISIDVPSGLFIDDSSADNTIIQANYTLTFQSLKLGLLLQDNASYIGEIKLLHIGLHPEFLKKEEASFELVEAGFIKQIYRPRNRFAHKGHFGHALIAAGSWGKIGAAILAAKACLRSGVGLLTCYIPSCGYGVMQTSVPEAMVVSDNNPMILASMPEDLKKYSAIGIGPGIGTDPATENFLSKLIAVCKKPMVLDADALNCLALQKEVLTSLPPYSILTPHPKEFDRLFGKHNSDFERITTARNKAMELQIIILLKGHHTFIATPLGACYFNSTGNAGMAKGGCGDVLTGILTSLLAQGYEPVHAAIFGVYLHGLAGDLAAQTLSMEPMLPSDLTLFLSGAFKEIS